MVILWQDYFGEEGSKDFLKWNLDREKYRLGNAYLFISVYVEAIKKRMERRRIWLPCGRN